MVKVALWCIQDEPALRPTMKSVVLMLEGITEVLPPSHFFVLFEKSNFLKEHHLLSCLPFKNV